MVLYNGAMTSDRKTLYKALTARDPRFDGIFFVGVTSKISNAPRFNAFSSKSKAIKRSPDACSASAARPCTAN